MKNEVDEESWTYVASTPDIVVLTDNDGPDHIAGTIRATSDAGVEALDGRTEIAYEFAGDRGQLIVLAWGSSLADVLADPRLQVYDVPASND